MAYGGYQSTFANSAFPTYQRQASVNVAGGSNGSLVLPFSISNMSLEGQEAGSYGPWSHSVCDDPFDLINYAQNSIRSRKYIDNVDCEGETDLQDLVSKILDDTDYQDSYLSEGSLLACNPIWSSKTLREELPQSFKSEAKKQHNPTIAPNYMSCNALNKVPGQSVENVGDCQQPNGLAASQQCLFNIPNRDRVGYNLRPHKLPPGLPIPNIENTYLSRISANKGRGDSQPLNHFPDFSDVFRAQTKMNSPCSDPYYEDHFVESSAKPNNNEHFVPQDINELVSSFQSLMTDVHDGFPNMHRQTLGKHHEDSMAEQWKIPSPAVSKQSTPEIQIQNQLVGEFGTVQMERNKGVSDAFEGLPSFSFQNSEYVQQPKQFSGPYKGPNQYQRKMTVHKENTPLPVNMNMSQYSQYHIQQCQVQSKMKPQMHMEKKRMHISYSPEGSSSRSFTNCNKRGGNKKQAQNFEHLGSMLSQRFDGENNRVSARNTQQMPVMYSVNDPRSHSRIPIHPCNFNSRSAALYGSCAPAFNSFVSDMMTRRAESTFHSIDSTMTAPMAMKEEGLIQLHFNLKECYEQWRCLEKETGKADVLLTKTFLGKWTAAVSNTNLYKTPPNPTSVDDLIVNQMSEKARVENILHRMECLNQTPNHMNIQTALNRHHLAICITQTRRKEEVDVSKHQLQRAYFTENRDTLLLAIAVKDLATTTRRVRTALWSALQLTLPKPVKKQDHHDKRETTGTERCHSPFYAYSFKL